MKNQLILWIFFLLIFNFAGCEEDDSEKIEYPPLEKFNYRIISAIEYNDQAIISKSVYQYNGDSLTYYTDSSANISNEVTIEYPGDNKILMDCFFYNTHNGLTWRTYTLKISNERIVEVTYDNIKILYSYNSSGQILKTKVFHYEDSWKLNYTISYTYSSDNLIKWLFEFPNEANNMKAEFSYNGNEIKEMIQYNRINNKWIEFIKKVYTYTDGKITRIDKYEYYNNNWDPEGYIEYSYDSNGNLIRNNNIVYTYEEGTGNYRQIIFKNNPSPYLEPIPN